MNDGRRCSKGRDDGAAQLAAAAEAAAAEEEMRGEQAIAAARVCLGDRLIFNIWAEFGENFYPILTY